MRRLVVGALRARAGHAAFVALLAAVTVAAVVGAVAYTDAAVRDTRSTPVGSDGSTASALTSFVRGSVPTVEPGQIDDFTATLRAAARRSDLVAVVSVEYPALLFAPDGSSGATVIARDDVCPHLRVDGTCPAGAGQILLPVGIARRLGVERGDEVTVAASATPSRLVVAGTYDIADPGEPYWAGRNVNLPAPAVFVDRATVVGLGTQTVELTVDLVPGAAFADGMTPARLREVAADIRGAAPGGFIVNDRLTRVAADLAATEATLRSGVVVASAILLILVLLALGLVVYHSAVQRRPVSALAAVRGVPWRQRIALAVGPLAVALVTGGLVGAPAGLAAAWVAGPVGGRVVEVTATASVVAAAAATLAAMLAVAAGVEWRVNVVPLTQALRSTPPRSRWRGSTVDVAVVIVGAAAAYQVIAGGPGTGLAVLAPALVALAVAVLGARLVRPVAAAAGRSLLGRGRIAPGLAALHLARRPAGHGLVALVVVAIALVVQAVVAYDAADRAVAERARYELGAERVLDIGPVPDAGLVAAVAAADPGGRWAMAVSRSDTATGTVMALQASRLATVTRWPAAPDRPTAAAVAAALGRASNPALIVDGDGLSLDADVPDQPATRLTVTAVLVGGDAAVTRVAFDIDGAAGRRAYPARIDGCPAPCRVTALEFAGDPTDLRAGVRLHALSQSGPARAVASPTEMGSPARWRGATTDVALTADGQSLTVRAAEDEPVLRVISVDAPWPIPAVAAGGPEQRDLFRGAGVSMLDAERVPVDVTLTASTVPGLGASGLIVDYDTALRAVGGSEHRTSSAEVWLAPGTPEGVVTALRERLDVRGSRTASDRAASLWRTGPGHSFPLHLVAGAVGVVITMISVVAVALAERQRRRRELRALRIQGIAQRSVEVSTVVGQTALVAVGVLLGLGAGVLAALSVRAVLPLFVDGWTATAPTWWPRAEFAGPALLAAVVLVVAASVVAGRRLAVAAREDRS
jgi:putative ABC transport system permease protein